MTCVGTLDDPLLEATLENNGGPTATVALTLNSPAIDAGDPNQLFFTPGK